MRKKLLLILALITLVALASVGCSGGSPCPSTLTILSISEGDVFVMEAGTDSWEEAQSGMSLEIGDSIKTGDSSGAEITFFDGSTMEMEAGTQIEIISLDVSCDTGATTITLEQTMGTTLSRVTKLLDPASSYEVGTPTGVAAVRGSVMIVTVGGNDTTLITNEGGNIYVIWQGMELPVPVGQTLIIMTDQSPNFMPLAEDDAAITDEDNPVTVAAPGVLNNDSDLDVGDTLTVTSVDTSATVGALTAWNAEGSFTYDPDGQFEYLQAGSSTTDSFTYTVSDGNGGIDTATVTVTINGISDNDPPVAVNDTATTPEDTPITIDVLNNDFDINGDTLTVDSVTQGANGSAINNGGNVTYTPALGFNGTDSFNYTASDGNGGTDTATVNVEIIGLVVVSFPDEGTVYVGYEDSEGGDFDYNDFGMSMSIEEVYLGDCLHTISMTFESVIHLAGDSHDIHILRTLSGSTAYNYTIARTTSAQGTEAPEVMNASGQGSFDIVLFDSDYYTLGDTVTINIEITNGCESYDPTPEPPRWDLAPIFAYYDPYMNNRTTDTEHHIGDWQPADSPLPWPRGYDVPYILIVPVTGWEPPPESTRITDVYPDFDDYYDTGLPENWYE